MRRLPGLLVCMLAVVVVLGYCKDLRPEPQPRRERLIEVDELSPVVDSIACPPVRPAEPAFVWRFTIYAHDEAPFAHLVTPTEFLEYSYVFTPPAPAPPIYSVPEFSRFHKDFEAWVDGQAYPGEYTYICRVKDQAGNISQESVCRFVVAP